MRILMAIVVALFCSFTLAAEDAQNDKTVRQSEQPVAANIDAAITEFHNAKVKAVEKYRDELDKAIAAALKVGNTKAAEQLSQNRKDPRRVIKSRAVAAVAASEQYEAAIGTAELRLRSALKAANDVFLRDYPATLRKLLNSGKGDNALALVKQREVIQAQNKTLARPDGQVVPFLLNTTSDWTRVEFGTPGWEIAKYEVSDNGKIMEMEDGKTILFGSGDTNHQINTTLRFWIRFTPPRCGNESILIQKGAYGRTDLALFPGKNNEQHLVSDGAHEGFQSYIAAFDGKAVSQNERVASRIGKQLNPEEQLMRRISSTPRRISQDSEVEQLTALTQRKAKELEPIIRARAAKIEIRPGMSERELQREFERAGEDLAPEFERAGREIVTEMGWDN